jgi:hypothetical protein
MLTKRAITFMLTVAITLLFTACSSLNRVSGDEFIMQAKHINALESAQSTAYIGASKTRAYLEQWRASPFSNKGDTAIIWTPIAELPADIAQKIQAGQNPWQAAQ